MEERRNRRHTTTTPRHLSKLPIVELESGSESLALTMVAQVRGSSGGGGGVERRNSRSGTSRVVSHGWAPCGGGLEVATAIASVLEAVGGSLVVDGGQLMVGGSQR
ncbi:hypothetical protein Dimus_036808 [Dionaea muscipula]